MKSPNKFDSKKFYNKIKNLIFRCKNIDEKERKLILELIGKEIQRVLVYSTAVKSLIENDKDEEQLERIFSRMISRISEGREILTSKEESEIIKILSKAGFSEKACKNFIYELTHSKLMLEELAGKEIQKDMDEEKKKEQRKKLMA